jgi:predicted phage baseplate assembly protein
VNLLDLERIALSVPGTRIARAHAWASLHPDYPCLDAPGVITVVIVPEYPVDEPVPSPGLIDRVWRYLNRRRMVATTLEVTGPSYVQVTVTATVAIRTGASAASVIPRVVDALSKFLHPLAGGPASLGWPFGRSVYRAEILSLIQDVPGVDHVDTLSMESDAGGAQCGDIALCPTALTRSGAHRIEVL